MGKNYNFMKASLGMITIILLIFAPFLVGLPAFAQSTGGSGTSNLSISLDYDSSYSLETAEATHPLTIQTEYHLYHPGEAINVKGNLWTELVEKVENLDLVKVELRDGIGNVVAREDANVSNNGEFSTSLKLLDSAEKGTYTVSANAETDADALGIINSITSAALQSSIQIGVANLEEHQVNAENQDFVVTIASNSGISNFQFNQQDKKISFFVEGDAGTSGIAEITIPKSLLSGDMSVFVDQNLLEKENVLLKSSTEAAATFEINYHHSIHRVEIAGTSVVPEFSAAAIVMAGSIGAALAGLAFATRNARLAHRSSKSKRI